MYFHCFYLFSIDFLVLDNTFKTVSEIQQNFKNVISTNAKYIKYISIIFNYICFYEYLKFKKRWVSGCRSAVQ